MARQNRTTTKAEDKTPTPTQEEATVAETTETPTEAPAEVEINLDAFKAAVTEALTEADESTGQLPEAAIAKVNGEYRTLEGQKPKNAARNFLEESMMEAVGALNAQLARSYSDLKVNLSAAGGAKADKAPADPTAAFVQRVASLRLALSIVEGQRPEGEGIDEKVETLVTESADLVKSQVEYLADESEDKGDGPELTPVVRAAFKAASGKASGGSKGGTSSGVRRDIGKHILSAFAEAEVGTFLTIAEIAKHKSAEYGDDSPSQGAISARLFPTTTVEGIEPVEAKSVDGKNPKGARKVA